MELAQDLVTGMVIRDTYSSRKCLSPSMRAVICLALLRLKKGFFGGSSGRFTLKVTSQANKPVNIPTMIIFAMLCMQYAL